MKDLLLKRKTTTYEGEHTNAPVPVTILAEVTSDDEDEEDRWRVRLPESAKAVIVDGCDLHPHPNYPLTNVELVTLMMERSQTGALMQAFILSAIEAYAKGVVEAKAEDLDTGMIAGEAWRKCGLEALGWFVARDAEDQARRERN